MDTDATEAWDVFVSTTMEFLSKHPHQSPDLRARLTKARLEALRRDSRRTSSRLRFSKRRGSPGNDPRLDAGPEFNYADGL
jgi:hypothetical protein